MIQLINTSSAVIGGVTIAPYDTGTMGADFQTVAAGSHNISAGNYSVQVFNDGLKDITVNGDTVTPGNYWLLEAKANPVTQRLDLTPAITIVVPAGGTASYSTTTPSV